MKIEVCVDNIESAITAAQAGADRLELCSALALGGLSPSLAFVKTVTQYVSLPVVVMIRPRAGDFLFSPQELEIMLTEIEQFKALNISGFVIGALTPNAGIDMAVLEKLVQSIQGVEMVFHRAFDLLADPNLAIEQLIDLGFSRILTSGQRQDAYQGRKQIATYVKQAKGRISIMAGAGVNANNAPQIVAETGVAELHLSGTIYRPSLMNYSHCQSVMGRSSKEDSQINITAFEKIAHIRKLF